MEQLIERDAAEFGVHVKAGGWRLGLLVARNVKTGNGQGQRADLVTAVTKSEKVSAQAFGRQSGTSAPRVLRYLEAWDAAAAAGVVPPSVTLVPGQEVDLDADALPDWGKYYPPGDSNWTKASDDLRADYESAAAEVGTTAQQIARFAASPPAVLGAVKANPKIREAVRKELAAESTADDVRTALRDPAVRREVSSDREVMTGLHDDMAARGRELMDEQGVRPNPRFVDDEHTQGFLAIAELGLAISRARAARKLVADSVLTDDERTDIHKMARNLGRIAADLMGQSTDEMDDALARLLADGADDAEGR